MMKMVRINLIMAFALLFVATGVYAWTPETTKNIEELKILSRDKKEMPETMAGVTKIKAEDLKKWLDEGKKFVLLDSRLASDYEKEHIPGAIRLAPDDFEKDSKAADKVGLKKDDIIVNY